MKTHIRCVQGLLVIAILLAISAGGVRAEGFESLVLTQGGNAIGDASIKGTYFTINPSELTKQLLLTTINNSPASDVPVPPNPPNQSGGFNAVANTSVPGGLANFFGVSPGNLNNGGSAVGTEGSGFLLSLGALNVGDTIKFDYNFLTNDAPPPNGHNDFAFFTLSHGGTTDIQIVADTNDATFATTGVGNPFSLETHYTTASFVVSTAGNYTIGFGVVDATDSLVASGFLLDNIRVVPVPEPSVYGLGMAGAVLLLALRKRIKRTSQ